MKYIYLLDENNSCFGINNFYNDEQLQNIIRDNKPVEYIIMDEYDGVLGYKYEKSEEKFINLQESKLALSMNEIAMSQILLDLAKIKEKLGVI